MADQEAELPPGAGPPGSQPLAAKTVYCRCFSGGCGGWGNLPSLPTSASPAWFGQKLVFRGIKKKKHNRIPSTLQSDRPAPAPQGRAVRAGGVRREGVAPDVSTKYLQNSWRVL